MIAGTIVVTAAVVETLALEAAPVVVGIAVLLFGPAPLDDADTASTLAPPVVDGFNSPSAFATPAGPAGTAATFVEGAAALDAILLLPALFVTAVVFAAEIVVQDVAARRRAQQVIRKRSGSMTVTV